MSRAAVTLRPAGRAPRRFLLRALRPTARWVLGRRVNVQLSDAHQVPASGPAILAGNHVGALDGPLLAIFSPRPVHALTKQELFRGPLGVALRWVGQIRLNRFGVDPAAVRSVMRVLADGNVAGIFPEGTRGRGDFNAEFHRGAAYLALVTGAPIVPVTFIGSGPAAGSDSSVPPAGSDITMVYGAPFTVPATSWPRTKTHVAATTQLLREHMRAERARALASTIPVGPAVGGDGDVALEGEL